MKAMKKIGTLFLALCLTISCFSLTAFAADGRISFSDPSTAVGDEVEITCAVRPSGSNFGTVEVDLDYDTDYLRYRSGEGVTEGNSGELILSSDTAGSEATFTMKFQALKEGTTKVTIESYRVTDESGDSMDFTMGDSTVTIAEGDPSKIEDEEPKDTEKSSSSGKTATVEVNGVSYTLTGDFPDADIPNGYTRTDISLGGEELPMLRRDSNGAVLGYLVDSDSVGDFYYYDQDDESWWPYEEVAISDTTTLLLLSDTSKVSLPEIYKQATLTINNKDFPTWQDTSNDEGYYIIYGLSSNGDKGYYRYDSKEATYQRFDVTPEEETEEDTQQSELPGFLGTIEDFVQDHLTLVILAAAVLLVILLILLLVLAVKLHNRNSELDELYDEYGIDEEPEPEPEPTSRKEKKKAKKAREEEEFDEDYAEDLYGGDDFDDEDYEDYPPDDEEYTEEILSEEDLEDFEEDDFFDESYSSDEDPLDLSGNLSEAMKDEVSDKTVAIKTPAKPKTGSGSGTGAKKGTAAGKTSDKNRSAAAAASASAKKNSGKKVRKTSTSAKSVDEDLADVPEDEDIFAGYDKREELTLDDLWGEDGKKKKKGHQEDDDSFKVDFIDLD